ncbi:MAG: hypothetical protein WC346_21255 [Methanogenium sp.]|jgi:vacuolar-type H+-ATPase subunit I/STV1
MSEKKAEEANKAKANKAKANKEKVTVVKRTKEGLILLKNLQGKDAQKVKAIFSKAGATDYRDRDTKKISQCSLINKRLHEGKKVAEIAEELIALKLFPVKRAYESKEETKKACIARIRTHMQCSKRRGVDLSKRG